ncbi:methanogen output domain 1-containing protein [Beggiatoa leptomitoformis]|uniref:Transcriptional regulator n=1 Tax=Beggiatoa leptomitoformis TaxID=288004 RepID=A0A2N9YAQ1_9GAMM|nr:methanogen output domain 1-containing protein [Beggiatoa leptomitoformis]ALG67058.1 transcriptional regulator [Beggiatoa leptomitoformis]AUI67557.1 transcriptional regulator [Beggiatoa leptomitoformis]
MHTNNAAQLDISLARDVFLRSLIRELSGVLEEVVGIEQANGFISVVGQNIGEVINQEYRTAFNVSQLSHEQVAQVLVDLKRRIQGDFYIISQDAEKIIFGNHRCPFEDKVIGRNSLCMMTSNVFGTITAENLGYAKIELVETIARGHDGCRVVVYLKPESATKVEGNEYFRT